MPRIRTIKPEMFASPQVMNLSRDARLLFIGQISQADDEGRGSADPRKLKAVVFGGDDDITCARVLELLVEVESQALCITYDGGSHGRLYCLPSFRSHQYVSHPKDSGYPAPPVEERNRNGAGTIQEHSCAVPEGLDLKDLKEGSGTRARVVSNAPVDNSARRPRASDGDKKRQAEIRRRRREVEQISRQLAAAAKP